MSTVEDYNARMAGLNKKALRTYICKTMRLLGAAVIVAEYEGSDDSGSIVGVEAATSAAGIDPEYDDPMPASTAPVDIPDDLNDPIQNILYGILDHHYGGWENSDGARGWIIWDLTADKLHLHHTAYITETCYSYVAEGGTVDEVEA